jgi:hypothetical protein
VQAARIVRDYPGMSGLAVQLPTNDAGVARETLVGLRETDGNKAHDAVVKAAKAWDGKDTFLVKALAIAAGGSDARRQAVLADFASSFPEWNDRTAALAFELRPPGMTERLRGQLSNLNLANADRIRLIDFVAGDSNPAAGKALLDILVPTTPAEVRNRAVDVLVVGLPGQWSLLVKDGTAGKALESMVASSTNGMASAQLYWGRVAALLIRLLYSAFPMVPWHFVYVDDFAWILPRQEDGHMAMSILSFLLALGLPLSLRESPRKKTELGSVIKWLGFVIHINEIKVLVPQDKQNLLDLLLARIEDGVAHSALDVQKLVGRLQWASTAWPLTRPWLQPFWSWMTKIAVWPN